MRPSSAVPSHSSSLISSVGGLGVPDASVLPVGIDLVGAEIPYYYAGSVGSHPGTFESIPDFVAVDAWEAIEDDASSRCAVCGDPVAQTGKSVVRTSTCPCCRLDGFCLSKPTERRKKKMVVKCLMPDVSCGSLGLPDISRDPFYQTLVACSKERYGGGVGRSVIDWEKLGITVAEVSGSRWVDRFEPGALFDTSIVQVYLALVARHFSSDRSKTFVSEFDLWVRLIPDNYNRVAAKQLVPKALLELLKVAVGTVRKPVAARQVRRLLVPVRIPNCPHFWLLVVDFIRRVVLVFDSAPKFQEVGSRLIGITNLQVLLGTSFPVHVVACNQQTSWGNDCGVHVCMFAWVACVGMTGLPPGRADAVVCVDANKDGRCSIYAAGDVLSFSLANTVHRFEAFLRSRASYSRRQICSVIDGTVIGDPFYQAYASEHKHDGVALEHVEGRIFADWMALWAYEVDNLTRVHDGIQRLYADREWRDTPLRVTGRKRLGHLFCMSWRPGGITTLRSGRCRSTYPCRTWTSPPLTRKLC